ncbi:MAG TPA: hypothetical protein VKV15_11970 [Bryobacteraceae bacterium]|nr:hypothetical protein [Bryobacteraceae bacterium]
MSFRPPGGDGSALMGIGRAKETCDVVSGSTAGPPSIGGYTHIFSWICNTWTDDVTDSLQHGS